MEHELEVGTGTVERLHRELVRAILTQGGAVADGRVTVAEIYQELVPYRNVRDAIGVELAADYEHALIRLLAGEDDLVRLEPESARAELRRELASTNPNVGLYRKFAACDVHVSLAVSGELSVESSPGAPVTETAEVPEPADAAPASLPELPDLMPAFPDLDDEGPASAPEPLSASVPKPVAAPTDEPAPKLAAASEPEPAAASEPRPAPEPVASPPVAGSPAAAAPGPDRAGEEGAPGRGMGGCKFCQKPLPSDRPVRYCPFCGEDQRRQPCPECSEVLEPDWRFCIACGAEAPAA